MKELKKILTIITLIGFSFTLQAQSYLVESDMTTDADFDKYESYQWASGAMLMDNTVYSLNDVVLKAKIVKAVQSEMKGHGFERAENADLVVNFIVFEEATTFTGYSEASPDFYTQYWKDFTSDNLGEVKDYNMKKGTLLIQFYDPNKNHIVWQGYASGIMDGEVFDTDEVKIREAVELIFDELDERADAFDQTGR